MNRHGGARSGAGRRRKWTFDHVLSIGQACEIKWREASQKAVQARLAALPNANEIAALLDGVAKIPPSDRKRWLKDGYDDHVGDLEGWLHERAGTKFDERTATFEGEAPRVVTVSTKPARGSRKRIIQEVAVEFAITESAVDNLWQAYRRFERESRPSAES